MSTALAAISESTAPTSTPIPISSLSSSSASPSPRVAAPCSSAIKNSKTGTHKPSFKPLSALKPSLRWEGTLWLVTTAFPNAASVAASMVPSMAASYSDSVGNNSTAQAPPIKILPGRPSSNILPGNRQLPLSTPRFALAASTNRNKASVISMMALPLNASPVGLNHSSPSGPRATPRATNTIGPDSESRSMRSEIRL